MSLNGLMRTGVSGMAAQSTRLSSIADNIANNDTTGYKRVSVEFSNLLTHSGDCPGQYSSGAVDTKVRHHISEQGALEYTTSETDLAINGDGFFMVEDATGAASLTRAGAFVRDGSGYLINSAGQYLMGYAVTDAGVDVVANGTAGLERIQVNQQALQAQPTTTSQLQVNLPAGDADIPAANLPSANVATSEFSDKTSMVVYSNLGEERLVDVYWAKVADESWEVALYDRDQSTNGGFPYSAGPLTSATVGFDPVEGTIISPTSLSFTVPDGQPATMDLTGSTQLAADYAVLTSEVNGQAPSGIQNVAIDGDGSVVVTFMDGTLSTPYRVPLAKVTGTDLLSANSGNLFLETIDSGGLMVGFPEDPGFGVVQSGALEQSTVDLGDELTQMIESQRNYSANSKVFQTGSELLEILVNLKR